MTISLDIIRKYLLKNYWSLAIILIFLIFFSFLYYNSFNAPWEGDEGEYAYSAWLITQGEVPYLHSFLQKPPLIIYNYYLTNLIKPFALWPPRALAFIFTLANCLLLALIAKKLYGKKAGWVALWISAPLLSLPHIVALPANTEKFMLLPLVGLIALFVFKQGREKQLTYFWAGVLSALAILYKPIALPPVFFLIIYWLVVNWLKTKNIKETLKSFGLIFLGGIIITFLVLFYFIIHGAIGEMWRQVVIYNLSYIADTRNYFPAPFFHYLSIFFSGFWPIGLIVLGSFFYRSKLIYLWWSLFLVSLLPIITTRIGHYYLLLVPFLVLLAAGTLASLLVKIKIKEEEWKNIILTAIIALILVVFSCFMGEQFFLKPLELSDWIYGSNNNMSEAQLVANKVKAYTKPDERIFVNGSAPQIYYFSQRISVSKFNTAFPLSINTPWRGQYQQQAIEELKKNKPAAMVIPRGDNGLFGPEVPTLFIDFLNKELEDNYYLVGEAVPNYQVSTYLGPIWIEPSQTAASGLFLYVKKPD